MSAPKFPDDQEGSIDTPRPGTRKKRASSAAPHAESRSMVEGLPRARSSASIPLFPDDIAEPKQGTNEARLLEQLDHHFKYIMEGGTPPPSPFAFDSSSDPDSGSPNRETDRRTDAPVVTPFESPSEAPFDIPHVQSPFDPGDIIGVADSDASRSSHTGGSRSSHTLRSESSSRTSNAPDSHIESPPSPHNIDSPPSPPHFDMPVPPLDPSPEYRRDSRRSSRRQSRSPPRLTTSGRKSALEARVLSSPFPAADITDPPILVEPPEPKYEPSDQDKILQKDLERWKGRLPTKAQWPAVVPPASAETFGVSSTASSTAESISAPSPLAAILHSLTMTREDKCARIQDVVLLASRDHTSNFIKDILQFLKFNAGDAEVPFWALRQCFANQSVETLNQIDSQAIQILFDTAENSHRHELAADFLHKLIGYKERFCAESGLMEVFGVLGVIQKYQDNAPLMSIHHCRLRDWVCQYWIHFPRTRFWKRSQCPDMYLHFKERAYVAANLSTIDLCLCWLDLEEPSELKVYPLKVLKAICDDQTEKIKLADNVFVSKNAYWVLCSWLELVCKIKKSACSRDLQFVLPLLGDPAHWHLLLACVVKSRHLTPSLLMEMWCGLVTYCWGPEMVPDCFRDVLEEPIRPEDENSVSPNVKLSPDFVPLYHFMASFLKTVLELCVSDTEPEVRGKRTMCLAFAESAIRLVAAKATALRNTQDAILLLLYLVLTGPYPVRKHEECPKIIVSLIPCLEATKYLCEQSGNVRGSLTQLIKDTILALRTLLHKKEEPPDPIPPVVAEPPPAQLPSFTEPPQPTQFMDPPQPPLILPAPQPPIDPSLLYESPSQVDRTKIPPPELPRQEAISPPIVNILEPSDTERKWEFNAQLQAQLLDLQKTMLKTIQQADSSKPKYAFIVPSTIEIKHKIEGLPSRLFQNAELHPAIQEDSITSSTPRPVREDFFLSSGDPSPENMGRPFPHTTTAHRPRWPPPMGVTQTLAATAPSHVTVSQASPHIPHASSQRALRESSLLPSQPLALMPSQMAPQMPMQIQNQQITSPPLPTTTPGYYNEPAMAWGIEDFGQNDMYVQDPGEALEGPIDLVPFGPTQVDPGGWDPTAIDGMGTEPHADTKLTTRCLSNRLEWPEKYKDESTRIVIERRNLGPGLRNVGNTCYANSFLQALFLTTNFVVNLFRFELPDEERSKEALEFGENPLILKELQVLFAKMLTTRRDVVKPSRLMANVSSLLFPRGRHHDSSEFGRYLMTSLGGYEKALITGVFTGLVIHRITCLRCKNVSEREEQIQDLSLFLPDRPSKKLKKTPLSVELLINDLLKPELLDGTNKYQCDTCNAKQKAEKTMAITSPPSHLMITLNRFKWNVEKQEKEKIEASIYLNPRIKFGGFPFQLYAAVMHKGSTPNSGHYYTVGGLSEPVYATEHLRLINRRGRDDSEFKPKAMPIAYKFDDSRVTKIKPTRAPCDVVAAMSVDESLTSETPYVVFYRCLTPQASVPIEIPKKLADKIK
eukprot:Blabericola_migrator_1__9311@NODE_4_length_29828_cov_96_571587_g3_i0_p4_GENE_NODE_4_length_29828_cov_96_571587_g3_i0NODE_4_length_29828_cov_96_571587_g3_i0_p4_ORF_typecomplete_len1506_score262_74UCH/PF00443_29/9_7e52UCH_1/PF13423_6/1_8e17CpXC/PF14353_6/1e04CpXC/PF14353_6/0_1_NODE_4_length_29828_cov_96_571587_g3_i02526829785